MANVEVPDADGVDDLYGGDPGEFVAARDRLAKELKAAGDREAAVAVKRLRRPTLVAWAVNQVARDQPEALDELAEATAGVRRAQDSAVGGGSADGPGRGPGDLREAARRRREVVATLAQAAAELAGAAHHDQAAATIDAASLDPNLAPLLRRGRLSRELEPPAGFGFTGDGDVAGGSVASGSVAECGSGAESDGERTPEGPPPAPPAALVDLEPRRRAVERAGEGVTAARDELERAQGSVAAAEEDLKRAEDALLVARAAVTSAQDDVDRAVGERLRAQDALAQAAPEGG